MKARRAGSRKETHRENSIAPMSAEDDCFAASEHTGERWNDTLIYINRPAEIGVGRCDKTSVRAARQLHALTIALRATSVAIAASYLALAR